MRGAGGGRGPRALPRVVWCVWCAHGRVHGARRVAQAAAAGAGKFASAGFGFRLLTSHDFSAIIIIKIIPTYRYNNKQAMFLSTAI